MYGHELASASQAHTLGRISRERIAVPLGSDAWVLVAISAILEMLYLVLVVILAESGVPANCGPAAGRQIYKNIYIQTLIKFQYHVGVGTDHSPNPPDIRRE